MKRVVALGAFGTLIGAVAAIMLIAFAAEFFIDSSVGAVVLNPFTGRARPQFVATEGSTYLFLFFASAPIGGALAHMTWLIGRQVEPDTPRFGLPLTAASGILVAPIIAYSALRTGIGAAGVINQDVITLSVFRAVVVIVVTGAVTGLVTVLVADRVSRVEVLGLGGAAWPRSRAVFTKESMRAVGVPMAALLVIAAVVIGVSRIFLLGPGLGAVVAASVVAVAILAAAAFTAYRGGDDQPSSTK